MKTEKRRFLEIDALRTCAILFMIAYHGAFDLRYYYHWDIDLYSGIWWVIGRSAAVLFLLLVGTSFIVATQYKSPQEIWKRARQRGGVLLAMAALISVVTYSVDVDTYIRFGILHCIGISILLMPIFLRFKEWNLCIGIFLTVIGIQMKDAWKGNMFLIPFGMPYEGFQTLDYFPLLPWLGVVLIGMGIGYVLYIDCGRQPIHISNKWRKMTLPGKYSLLIYLVHQPILLGLLYLMM